MNFTQQCGKNCQRCEQNNFTMLYDNYCYNFIESFPQKFSPCTYNNSHMFPSTILPLLFSLTFLTLSNLKFLKFPILPIFLIFPISFINIFSHRPVTFLLLLHTLIYFISPRFTTLTSLPLLHCPALFPMSYFFSFYRLFATMSRPSLCTIASNYPCKIFLNPSYLSQVPSFFSHSLN